MLTALVIVSALLAVSLVGLVWLWVAYWCLAADLMVCDAERLRLQQVLLDKHRESVAAKRAA